MASKAKVIGIDRYGVFSWLNETDTPNYHEWHITVHSPEYGDYVKEFDHDPMLSIGDTIKLPFFAQMNGWVKLCKKVPE